MTRRLYPIYAAIAREFQLGDPPCKSLDEVNERSQPDVLQRITRWLEEMDHRIQAHHFRQLLQTSDLASSEEKMHTLVDRYLNKEHRTEFDRDKIDFLLIQYFAVCAPPSFHDRAVSLEEVAEVLEPILGEYPTSLPEWLQPLEQVIADMQACRVLADLGRQRVIERGRELKTASGERYFGPGALLAFVRFNFLLRRACSHLAETELGAIEGGLWELGARSVYFVDCASVQLSPQEPLSNLFQLCLNLRKPLILDYSTSNSFDLLMELRAIIERALAAPQGLAPDLQRRLERLEEEMAELRALLMKALAQASLAPPPTSAAVRPDLQGKPREAAIAPAPTASPAPLPVASPRPGAAAKVAPTPQAAIAPAPAASAALPHAASARPGDAVKVVSSVPANIAVQIEHIKELLSIGGSRGQSPVSLAISPTTKLLLTTAEVNAFAKDGDEVGMALQRAVAARVLLVATVESSKRTKEKPDLKPLLQLARDESANLQTLIGNAAKASHTSLAEVLSFTHRQLLAVITQVEGRSG